MLKNFNNVSIRERNSLTLLTELGRADGVAVCDPVFLLTKEQWNSIIPYRNIQDKYLLVYDTERSEKIKVIAKRIAKIKNLNIYNISAFKLSYANKDFWASGPLEFVRLIRDAQVVISNSFHASAFSIIFERDFYVINRSEEINERMKSLLADFGIDNRLVSSLESLPMTPINYEAVNRLKENKILASKRFLNDTIG